MKFSKSATIIAALAMASTTAITLSQQQVDAASIAMVTTQGPARLYSANGTKIANRALASHTPWRVGKTISIDGTNYCQVSTNEYLKASDASLNTVNNDSSNYNTNKKLVGRIVAGDMMLYRDDTQKLSNRALGNGSSWLIGKHIINKYGQHFVQVSTHEYGDGTMMLFNMPVPEPTYIADFGENVSDHSGWDDNSDNSTDTNTNTNDNTNTDTSVDTNTNTNTNNTTNNNSSNTTDNNNSGSTSTSTDTASYTPDLNKINDYFTKYVNALHAANGTAPVQSSADMISYAQQRAGQQNGLNLDHGTASRDTSENLEGGGFNYMKYAGVKSDKEAAYFLLKGWYDEDSNYAAAGTAGHYGHRAALIYSGPTIGLGITDTDASFDADWNNSELDNQNALYYYTGSNPDTKFISEDSVQ